MASWVFPSFHSVLQTDSERAEYASLLYGQNPFFLSFCLFFVFVITVVDLIRLAFGHSTLIHDFVTSIFIFIFMRFTFFSTS